MEKPRLLTVNNTAVSNVFNPNSLLFISSRQLPDMITKQVIDNIYKSYPKRPTSPDKLNLGLLFGEAFDQHCFDIDDEHILINSIDAKSPFHSIPLRNIHAIVDFADHIAIVLHSSIIFLSKNSPEVHIHIKAPSRSLGSRLLDRLRQKPDK